MNQLLPAFVAVLGCLTFSAPVLAAEESTPPSDCSNCHNDRGDREGLPTPYEALPLSVHSGLECTDCHTEFSLDGMDPTSPKPHGELVRQVDCGVCGECHEDEAEVYQQHGRLAVESDPDMPSCWHCHGTHDIFPTSDRRSHTHRVNLPDTCRACHTDVDLVKKHEVLRDAPIRMYENSVHGKATRKGIYVAATCNDCHSAPSPDGKRTAHRIFSAADPQSTIYHFRIPDTCGQCHESIVQDYWDGIHGQFVKRGDTDAPVCTHCHGEHGIISPDDPRSPVSAIKLAERTCTPCHESAILNEKYGIAGGRLTSYIDSYHGLKSGAGDTTVANCSSCHGAHRVLPSTDPTSSIHVSNLQQTCGECHPGISAELAQTRIHEAATGAYTGWPEFFRKLYIVLIVATIGGMLLHNGADWIRQVRNLRRGPYVQRLSYGETAQHWALMSSFIILVVTGFALRFSDAGWVRILFAWDGGFETRGIIHRCAAIVMVGVSIWHALYMLSARGRRWCRDMLPTMGDVRHVLQNVLYFLGFRDGPPRFARFSYVEKLEYWALVWGTAIMTATGFLLWFDDYFVARWGVPKVVLDVALVVHFYEAWLAALAILVWHIYGTVFNPSAYPMNTAWLTGKMPRKMYIHEHPDGPNLRARTYPVRVEDDVEQSEEE